MEDVVMDGDLFHSYHFSLCAGMGDVWSAWSAFTCAINAMGLKMSLMSL